MDFNAHRPHQRLGRSERALVNIAQDLTRFLAQAQRSLRFETLRLSRPQRETLAAILVEFAEDLHQDIGIWRALEYYNLANFGTPLPCILQPDEAMDRAPINPARVQFLLWTLYSELRPELLLAPTHQDLTQLATAVAAFLHQRLATVRLDSGVKTFLATPNTYGWEVKRKLVWLGQHSYLFRLPCENYIQANGGKPDIPILDDFLCQQTTGWSGLGVIDLLAALLPITEAQRATLRRWYERHIGYFRVLSVREPFLDVVNVLNEQTYTVRVDENAPQFQRYQLMFGGLVPWDEVWYWSGEQRGFATVTEDLLRHIRREFPLKAPRIVYRYCESLAEQARTTVSRHYQQFMDYYGKDLVIYPDGNALAEAMRQFHRYQMSQIPKENVDAFLKKHDLAEPPAPRITLPPKLLDCHNGIGVYFNPQEGQEIMLDFNDIISGFEKQGDNLTETEAQDIRSLICGEVISPNFVHRVVQDYGDASIAAVFLIPRESGQYYLEYLLRRYKGQFYRNRYPNITLVDY